MKDKFCPRGRGWGRIKEHKGETPALVAVITRKKDFEILRKEYWYRIPVKSAPEGLEKIRFIAFYQTKVFGEEKWAVNYYAEVKGIRQVRRIELLPDEPGHKRAEEFYFRVEVGELMRLPQSIPSRRWRRIVFIPTTLERLLRAREVNDLYCTSPIEEKLYRALERAGLEPERQFYVREKGSDYFLDIAVFCKEGELDVECDGEVYHSGREKAEADRRWDNDLTAGGWRIIRLSGRGIKRDTKGCVRLVQEVMRKLGGVEVNERS